MIETQFSLLAKRRFLPLFLTQFLGAFNDNLFKSALVILITFRLAETYNVNAQIMITAVAGLFILPFFLFSSLAGQIADKYEKSFLIRIIKLVEVILMCLTAAAFETMHLWWLIFLLFCMGTQSTFFGPLKFSILPQLLNDDELVAGNGLVNAGTNIAILTGTLCGGLFILSPLGRHYISAGVVGVAVAGYAASRFIPTAEPSSPGLRIDRNLFRSTWEMLVYPFCNRDVFRSIIGISWFWFLGSVFLAQFPSFAKDALGGDEQVSTLFLVLFSVGVGAGATFCNKLRLRKVPLLQPYRNEPVHSDALYIQRSRARGRRIDLGPAVHTRAAGRRHRLCDVYDRRLRRPLQRADVRDDAEDDAGVAHGACHRLPQYN